MSFYDQAKATATGVTPMKQAETMTVDPKSTVAGQMTTLLSSNSPYIRDAQSRAKQVANSRGLINSSMAAQSGELAAIQSALPIAQQDAQANFTAQTNNMQAKNQFGLQQNDFNQQRFMQDDQQSFASSEANKDRTQALTLQGNQFNFQGTQASLDRNQQLAVQSNQFGQDRLMQEDNQAFQTAENNATRQQQTYLAQMDQQTRYNLANIEADFKTLMQTSANAQELFRETSKNIAAIQLNEKLDAASKRILIVEQEQLLKNSLEIQGKISNLNLGSLVTFTG